MPRTRTDLSLQNFIRGFITETTQLQFPENSCLDIDNCDLEVRGSVRRRLALNEEPDGQLIGIANSWRALSSPARLAGVYSNISTGAEVVPANEQAVTCHIWPAPAGQSGTFFIVIQIANTLRIYNWDGQPISSPSLGASLGGLTGTFSFDGASDGIVYQKTWAEAARLPLQSASGFGRLWMVGPHVLPFYIEYDPETNSISSRPVGYDATISDYLNGRLDIRDFNGVPDGLRPNEFPSTLSNEHKYNLYNQGWSNPNILNYFDFTSNTTYPSNSQQSSLAKNSSQDFDPGLLQRIDFGNGRAPRGRATYNALTGVRDLVFNSDVENSFGEAYDNLSFGGLYNQPASSAFSTCAFFAGRLWLSGDENSFRPSGVYWSKTMQVVEDAGVLMQEQDPTSEEFTDLLATDGGVVYITEADTIRKLVPFGQGMLVFADNGIWFVYGGEGTGAFTATSIAVEKISSTGAISFESIVDSEGVVLFFTDNAIHRIEPASSGVLPVAVDITRENISSYYNRIQRSAREYAQGCYDKVAKRVVWSWLEDDSYNYPARRYQYNRMLIYDLRTSAFTKYSFADSAEYNGPAFPQREYINPEAPQVVLDGTDPVLDGTDEILAGSPINMGAIFINSIKVVLYDSVDEGLRLGEFYGRSFLDHSNTTNRTAEDYTSFVIAAPITLNDIQRNKDAIYVHSAFEKTETAFVSDGDGGLVFENPSGCFLRGRWDWHATATGGRWSALQQAYLPRMTIVPSGAGASADNGEGIVYSKRKVRGRARALTLEYTSQTGKDFRLLGTGVPLTVDDQ